MNMQPDTVRKLESGEFVWWISFVDTDQPEPTEPEEMAPGKGRFVGLAIVDGTSEFIEAVRISHRLGLNPGGQVSACVVPRAIIPPGKVNTFVPKAEVEAFGAQTDILTEAYFALEG